MPASPMAPEVPASISSDSESSVSEEEPSVEIDRLQKAVKEKPSDFDAHLALVNVIRSKGSDYHALRIARENFAQAFPLPPYLWKEWIDDELRIAPTSAEKSSILLTLFPKALADYMDVDLHLKRLDLAIAMSFAGEICADRVKELFSDSIDSGAVAAIEGGEQLWDKYQTFMTQAGEDPAALLAFRTHALRGHLFAMQDDGNLTDECLIFERKLREKMEGGVMELGYASADVVMQFRSYAAYAKDISVILAVSVYERCISACFFDPAIWLEYIRFCQVKRKGYAYSVCQRAARNVPCVMEIWACTVLAIPDAHEDLLTRSKAEEYALVLRQAKDHVMRSNDMRGAELLTKTIWSVLLALGQPFTELSEILTTLQFNVSGSFHWASAQCYAASTLRVLGDLPGAYALFEEVVTARPHESRWWLAYIKVLNDAGGASAVDKVRELFERALLGLTYGVEIDLLSDAWMRFECESHSERTSLAQRITNVCSTVESQRVKCVGVRRGKGSKNRNETRTGRKARAEKGGDRDLPKRKRAKSTAGVQSNALNSKEDAMVDSEEANGLHTVDEQESEGLDAGMSISQAAAAAAEHTSPKNPLPSKEIPASSATKLRRGDEQGAGGNFEAEPRTIFINNLAFNVSEEELRADFEFAGKITGIRIPRRSDGASKGIAYVEFEDDECVEKALTKHMKPIKGRSVWVRRSKPPSRKTKKTRSDGQRSRSERSRPRGGSGGLMQPRAVHRRVLVNAHVGPEEKDSDVNMKDGGDENVSKEDDGTAEAKPKSQDDFRAMFMLK